MPQVFKIGSYWVYFWANENEPLEPVHVPCGTGRTQRQRHQDMDHPGREVLSEQQ